MLENLFLLSYTIEVWLSIFIFEFSHLSLHLIDQKPLLIKLAVFSIRYLINLWQILVFSPLWSHQVWKAQLTLMKNSK